MVRVPAALTIRHTIDAESPLFGEAEKTLQECEAFFLAGVTSVETVMAASVESQQDYSWSDIRSGERFSDIYEELSDGQTPDPLRPDSRHRASSATGELISIFLEPALQS